VSTTTVQHNTGTSVFSGVH